MGFLSGITSALGGGGGGGGGLFEIGNAFATKSMDFGFGQLGAVLDQQRANAAAGEDRAFIQKQMMNKHQWEVADLKAAGLNPILSANQSGTVVGGHTTSAASAPLASMADYRNAQSNARRIDQVDKARIKNETTVAAAQAAKDISQGALNADNAALAREQILTQRTNQAANSAVAARELASVPVQGALAKYYRDGASAALANANQSNASAENMRIQNAILSLERQLKSAELPGRLAIAPHKALSENPALMGLLPNPVNFSQFLRNMIKGGE